MANSIQSRFPLPLVEAQQLLIAARTPEEQHRALHGFVATTIKYLSAQLYAGYRQQAAPHAAVEQLLSAGQPLHLNGWLALLRSLLAADGLALLSHRFDELPNPELLEACRPFMAAWHLLRDVSWPARNEEEALLRVVRQAAQLTTRAVQPDPMAFLSAATEYLDSAIPIASAVGCLLDELLKQGWSSWLRFRPIERALHWTCWVKPSGELDRASSGQRWLQVRTPEGQLFAVPDSQLAQLGPAPGYLVRLDPAGQAQPRLLAAFDWEAWQHWPAPLLTHETTAPQADLVELLLQLRAMREQLTPPVAAVLQQFGRRLGLEELAPADPGGAATSEDVDADELEAADAWTPSSAPASSAPSTATGRPADTEPKPEGSKVQAILELLADGRPHRKGELIDRLGLTTGTWLTSIKHLVDQGLVIREGIKRATTYRLATSPSAADEQVVRDGADPAEQSDRAPAFQLEEATRTVLALLRNGARLSKGQILERIGAATDSDWRQLMANLKKTAQIVTLGEKRNTVYGLASLPEPPPVPQDSGYWPPREVPVPPPATGPTNFRTLLPASERRGVLEVHQLSETEQLLYDAEQTSPPLTLEQRPTDPSPPPASDEPLAPWTEEPPAAPWVDEPAAPWVEEPPAAPWIEPQQDLELDQAPQPAPGAAADAASPSDGPPTSSPEAPATAPTPAAPPLEPLS